MKRRFNDTGLCVRNMHYMVDTNKKTQKIFDELIEYGEYFSILGGRQFGKTTTIELLAQIMEKRDDYLLIETSFEGIGDNIYQNETTFSKGFLMNLYYKTKRIHKDIAEEFKNESNKMLDFETLSDFITNFNDTQQAKVVLIIDEVDKSLNSQIFLHFLGMLREKYLLRNKGRDSSFHSVILAGVHDIKTIKLKLRPNEEQKLNSPWNIAADLNVDLSFKANQIETLLEDFLTEHPNINIPIKEISEKLYYYTGGYPYLVSKMCKIIYEQIIRNRDDKNWYLKDVETAFRKITYGGYSTTLFESNAKNLQNDDKLYKFISEILFGEKQKNYIINDKQVYLAKTYGLIKNENGKCMIHNPIFSKRFYDLILSIMDNADMFKPTYSDFKYYKGEDIDLEYILQSFQVFFKENYSHTDKSFIEREGRLIFLGYLQPIINGSGYVFKEPMVGNERRMDLVIIYNKKRYVIELKIWRGESYHQNGLEQLNNYLDIYSLKKGYMLIFNFNKNKVFKNEIIKYKDKELYAVWA